MLDAATVHAVGVWYEEFSQTTDRRGAGAARARPIACTAASGIGAVYALTGAATDYDPVVERASGRPRSCCSARRRTARTSSIASAPEITKRLIAEHGFTPWRSRPTGPTPTASTATSAAPATTRRRARRCADFRRFPTWMWRNADVAASSSAGCARATTLAGRSAQVGFYGLDLYSLARVDGGGASRTSTSVDPAAARRARERYACFDHVRPRCAGLRCTPRARRRRAVRARGRRAARRAAAAAQASTAADGRSPRTSYFYAEQNARVVTQRRGVLPRDVPRRARDRGTCATATWPTRSTRSWRTSTATATAGEGGRVGAQLARRRRPRNRDGRSAASSTSASSCVSGTAREVLLRRLHHLHRHRHCRVGLGRARPSASRCARRWPGARRRLSTSRTRD